MNQACDQFFPGARLAFDDDGRIFGGGAANCFINLDHRRRAPDHLGLGQVLVLDLLLSVLLGLRALHRLDHDVQFEGLCDVIEDAAACRRPHRLHGAATGHQDYRTVRILTLGGIENVEPSAFVDVDVGDDDRVRVIGEALHGLPGGRHGVHLVSLLLQRRENGELQPRIVFYQQ